MSYDNRTKIEKASSNQQKMLKENEMLKRETS